jgi:hypothetical protein
MVSLLNSMTCPQIAGRGDSFQLFSVAVNILHKKLKRGGPSARGLDKGLTNAYLKSGLLKNVMQGLGHGIGKFGAKIEKTETSMKTKT